MMWRGVKPKVKASLLAAFVGIFLGCSRVSADREVAASFVDGTTGKAGPRLSLEVCANDTERARGMMFRRSLAEDRGMIFTFPVEREHVFWMKNTYIPLDMVFLSKEFKVVGMLENVTPLTEDRRSVGRPSTYVVELAGGVARKLNLKEGDLLRLHGTLPPAL